MRSFWRHFMMILKTWITPAILKASGNFPVRIIRFHIRNNGSIKNKIIWLLQAIPTSRAGRIASAKWQTQRTQIRNMLFLCSWDRPQLKHIISREVGVLYLIGLLGLMAPTEAKQLLQDWHVSLTLEGACVFVYDTYSKTTP